MPGERKPMSLDEVEAAALELPGDQIDELIDRLAERRGAEEDTHDGLMETIHRRVGEYDRGEVEGIPMEETLAKLRAMLK
jgi:hypothetical protein